MNKIILILGCFVLNGCVQVFTSVSMAGKDDDWFLYVTVPTMNFEFSKHGLFWGNVPDRYRISLTSYKGKFKYNNISLHKWGSEGYAEEITLTSGTININNCVATLDLYNINGALQFNGTYDIPHVTCHMSHVKHNNSFNRIGANNAPPG